MQTENGIKLPETDIFYCQRITEATEEEINSFTIDISTGYGLLLYLQKKAVSDEKLGLAKTYFVRTKYTDEIVGYFSLKAGMHTSRECNLFGKTYFNTVSGIELSNFAINSSFYNKYHFKGAGSMIFESFILPIVRYVSTAVGASVLYIYALPYPALINAYKKTYGFKRLPKKDEEKLHKRLRPFYDSGCIFMYQSI